MNLQQTLLTVTTVFGLNAMFLPTGALCGDILLNSPDCVVKNCAMVGDCPPQLDTVLVVNATCGNATGSATIIMEGNFPWTYQWQGGVNASGNHATGLLSGVYNCTVTDPGTPGCQTNITVVVGNSDGPQPTDIQITPATCDLTNGAATILPVGGPQTYAWDFGVFGNAQTGLIARTYSVVMTDGTGCTNVFPVVIPKTNPLDITASNVTDSYCGLSNATAVITTTGGSGNYIYNVPNFTSFSAGPQVVIVIDQTWGCQDSVGFVVTNINPSATIEKTVIDPTCNGGFGAVNVQVMTTVPVFNPIVNIVNLQGQLQNSQQLTAGTYYIEVHEPVYNCLAAIDSFTVSEPDALTGTYQMTPQGCFGQLGKVTIFPVGGNGTQFNFVWNDIAPLISPAERTGLFAGTYWVTISDALGCTGVVNNIVVTDDTTGCGGNGGNCNVAAGTLSATQPIPCLTVGGTSAISATALTAPVFPTGFSTLYLLVKNGVIQSSSVSANFTVNATGDYSILTFVAHPDSVDFNTLFTPNITTTGQLVTNLTGECYAIDLVGAAFNITACNTGGCTALAGTLNPVAPPCLDAAPINIAATTGTAATIPAGSTAIYLLVKNGVVTASSAAPNFLVNEIGTFTIHTLVYDVADLNIATAIGGSLANISSTLAAKCFALDAVGANFNITACNTGGCTALAGTLNPVAPPCFDAAPINISATTGTAATVPAGSTAIYLLVKNGVVTASSAAPNFSVNETGTFTIHTLVYNTADLNIATAIGGSLANISTTLAPKCFALDAVGAALVVNGCTVVPPGCGANAGIIVPSQNPVELSATNTAVLSGTAQGGNVPVGFQKIYLMSVNGTIMATSATINFPVNAIGTYCIHGFVYDPTTFSAAQIVPGTTTLAQLAALTAGKCAGLDLAGTCILVKKATDTCDEPMFEISTTDASCNNSIGTASVAINGTATDFEVVWFNATGDQIGTGSTISQLAAGQYSVEVTRIANPDCFTNTAFGIGNSDAPAVSIDSVANAICTNKAGYAALSSPVSGAQFVWSNTATGPIQSILAPGIYTVTTTAPGNNCPQITVVEILLTDPLEVSYQINALPYCNQPLGSATIIPTGGSQNYATTWGGLSANNLLPGNQQVIVVDLSYGCVDTVNFTLPNIQPTATVDITSTTPTGCAGINNGKVKYVVTAGNTSLGGFISQVLDGNNQLVDENNLAAGDYHIKVIDQNTGCEMADEPFSIAVGTGLSVSAATTDQNCNALGTAILTITNGSGIYGYEWSDLGSQQFDPKDRTDLVAGNYSVTVIDATGCTGVASMTIADDCIPGSNCTAKAGTMQPTQPVVCLTNGSAFIGGTPSGIVQPGGFQTIFMLIENGQLINLNTVAPSFTVTQTGIFTIHTVVYNPDSTDINGLSLVDLAQEFSTTCGSVDLIGATVTVENCTNCTTPQFSGIVVTNTICGQNIGMAAVSMVGGNAGFTFAWSGNISSTNQATGLAAGAYSVTVTQIGNPNCSNDTTILVTNTDGPAVTVSNIKPATCLAADGGATLLPANLTYAWKIPGGATLSGNAQSTLLAGNYTVTATDAAGCSTILLVEIPAQSPLVASVNIIKQPKCAKNTGIVDVDVTGGSGNYAYSLGQNDTIPNLFAGNYTVSISDITTGCTAVATFTLVDAPIVGSVDSVQVFPASCAGGQGGFVTFKVPTGFGFQIRDTATNTQVFNNNLPNGVYGIYATDQDGCDLAPVYFTMTNPQPIQISASVTDKTCQQGGLINLTVTGGTGAFVFDWNDLTGTLNPEDRTDLDKGFYSVIVTDSKFCSDTLSNILVKSKCSEIDTMQLILPINTSDTVCVDAFAGSAGLTYSLLPSGTTGSSSFGNWTLLPTGCVIYNAGNTEGYNVDQFCVVTTTPGGLLDTTCVIVSITTKPSTEETVQFTVIVDGSATACGNIPTGLQNPVIVLVDGGFAGSDAYGDYILNTTTGCLTFNAGSQTGFNVDTIAVSVCDTAAGVCHIIYYVPTILPDTACGDFIIPDSLTAITTDCPLGVDLCLDIVYQDILNYNIFDNGVPYTGGLLGCNNDTMIAYSYLLLPGQGSTATGPYTLNSWTVNGQVFTGSFENVDSLVFLMNQSDPTGSWATQPGFIIIGGNPSTNYGDIKVTQNATGATGILKPNIQLMPLGTSLHLEVGPHELIFKRIQTGCSDTLFVDAKCQFCPKLYDGPTDVQVNSCDTLVDICLNIPLSKANDYVITDNGVPVVKNWFVCEADTLTCYNYAVLPGAGTQGPFVMSNWTVNTSVFNFSFVNPAALLDSMKVADPTGNWTINSSTLTICGGNSANTYANMLVSQSGSQVAIIEPNDQIIPIKLSMKMDTGFHSLHFIDTLTTCDDIVFFYVDCPDIPTNDTTLTIQEGQSTTFCIDQSLINNPTVLADACPQNNGGNTSWTLDNLTYCVEITGLQFGVDTICLTLCNDNGECTATTVYVNVVPKPDTLTITLPVGTLDTICLNTNPNLVVTSITNDCPDLSGVIVDITPIAGTNCLIINPLAAGSDTACIVVCYAGGFCDTTVLVINSVPSTIDTLYITLGIGGTQEFCAGSDMFVGDVLIANYCPDASGTNANVTVNDNSNCVEITGLTVGLDTACIVICDAFHCDTTILIIEIDNSIGTSTVAMPDDTITLVNQTVLIPVIANDTVIGVLGNNNGVAGVTTAGGPTLGTVSYNPTTGVFTYIPFVDSCGIDSFYYVLEDQNGLTDTALVTVQILCEKVVVFTGISPNNDGLNETWTILGIDLFPKNEVMVFNRWGNMVFHKKGYTALDQWNGKFESSDLPDGTYFYMIDLGDGSEKLSGYLQINR